MRDLRTATMASRQGLRVLFGQDAQFPQAPRFHLVTETSDNRRDSLLGGKFPGVPQGPIQTLCVHIPGGHISSIAGMPHVRQMGLNRVQGFQNRLELQRNAGLANTTRVSRTAYAAILDLSAYFPRGVVQHAKERGIMSEDNHLPPRRGFLSQSLCRCLAILVV